jgi:hypothetical protein
MLGGSAVDPRKKNQEEMSRPGPKVVGREAHDMLQQGVCRRTHLYYRQHRHLGAS